MAMTGKPEEVIDMTERRGTDLFRMRDEIENRDKRILKKMYRLHWHGNKKAVNGVFCDRQKT